MRQLHVLLLAYHCAPDQGSVSQIGWQWLKHLSAQCRVTLVTHIRNRDIVTARLEHTHHTELVFINTEKFAAPLYHLAKYLFPNSEHGVSIISSLDYFLFDWVAYRRLFSKKNKARDWSLVHRVTPVTLSAPSWFCRSELPVVLGPLNSGLSDPPGFEQMIDHETKSLSHLARRTAHYLDALLGSNRRAKRILVGTTTTLKALPAKYHHKSTVLSENGVDLELFHCGRVQSCATKENGDSLKVLFVGRLQRVKAVNLLLDAVAKLRTDHIPVELTIIGDGSMRQAWQTQALELGISDAVTFAGAQPQQTVARAMAACDVFCLPSVRESGGAVLLEAMACGRPVIALDFGGPSDFVTDQVGRLLPMITAEQVTEDIKQTLKDAWMHPGHWRDRGLHGRDLIEKHYSWPAKIRAAIDIYGKLVSREGKS